METWLRLSYEGEASGAWLAGTQQGRLAGSAAVLSTGLALEDGVTVADRSMITVGSVVEVVTPRRREALDGFLAAAGYFGCALEAAPLHSCMAVCWLAPASSRGFATRNRRP